MGYKYNKGFIIFCLFVCFIKLQTTIEHVLNDTIRTDIKKEVLLMLYSFLNDFFIPKVILATFLSQKILSQKGGLLEPF